MNESTTYQAVRIGDIADWRLICVISDRGMSTYLKHSDPSRDIVTIFNESWPADKESLLEHIENAVYDHPQVLDDFSADIVLVAPESIWVPASRIADDEDEAARLYNQVYKAEQEDLLVEEVEEAACVYSLVGGLNAFLQRTFPGARLHSHLAVLAARFKDRSADMLRVYADVREGHVDFVAFDKRKLLMAASHPWHEMADIEYHLFNIMSVYDLNPQEVQVSVSGPRDLKTQLMRDLRKYIEYVMSTMMPGQGAKIGMPLAAALMVRP